MEIFELIFSLAQSTLRFTPILIFAAMAGVFSERAGIIDIGLEGKLLIGAFVSATVAHYAGFGLVGLFAAMAVCMVFGWLPTFFHGPIREKFVVLYLDGDLMVWAWYSARMLIGFWVGVSVVPATWYLRGPLMGFLSMLPLGLVSLAVPNCGAT